MVEIQGWIEVCGLIQEMGETGPNAGAL